MEESRKVYGWLVRDGNAAEGCSYMWTGTRGGENYCGNLLWQSGLALLFPNEESPDHVASISAITQCCWMSRTNELASMRQFVLNTQHPFRKLITREVVELSPLDDITTDFVEAIVTNVSNFSRYERGGALAKYEDKIIGADMSNSELSNACVRAVKMYYRNRLLSDVGADSFDPVLTKRLSGYTMSSNRLETALFVLSQTNCPQRLREYFTTITNQLLSSGQPLNMITVGEP